ncbi:MAG: Hsp20/alpha crystallin family protein [Christensenellales bacterium]|nr:Hsp20/alpha crystallin family protein [Clostridiales bacterium]
MFGLIPVNKGLTRPSNYSGGIRDFFDDFFNDFPSLSYRGAMKMDIRENEKEYIIDAELPGIKKDNITIDINENNLTVSANYQEDKKEEKGNYIHRERRMSSMSRTVYLPDMDEDGVKAKYSDGILCITVPKKVESSKRKTITVE